MHILLEADFTWIGNLVLLLILTGKMQANVSSMIGEKYAHHKKTVKNTQMDVCVITISAFL